MDERYTPVTPVAVERELRRLSHEGDERMDALVDLARTAAEAERAWKVGRAKALIRSEATSADRREAEALVACEAEYAAHLVATAELETAREAARWLRTRVEALRSIGAAVRLSYETTG